MRTGRKFLGILVFMLILSLVACGKKSVNWEEQYDLGIRYLSEGNCEDAILVFTAAIEVDAKQPQLYVGRGDAYIASGENAENLAAAQADYEAAIALDEANADAYLGLADVYIRRGDCDKAKEILKDALEKTGNDEAIADKLEEMESGDFWDTSGNIRRRNRYDSNGVLLWWHECTYNEQGEMTSVTAHDGSGNQTGHIDLAYNENDMPLIYFHFRADNGHLAKTEYEYDDLGNPVKLYDYDEDGTLDNYTLMTYDEAGNKVREDDFSPDGELKGYETYEYNGDGIIIKNICYDSSGEMVWQMIYNESGNIIEYNQYNMNNALESKRIYVYNEQDKLICTDIYDSKGNLIRTETNE